MSSQPRWIHVPRPKHQPTVRLYCFPFAGGTAAAYYPWAKLLPSAVELCAIQLPGHGERINEPLVRSLDTMIDALLPVLQTQLTDPPHRFAFFGHSLGALLAFELTRRLHDAGGPLPAHLFLSGRPAPNIPRSNPPLHFMNDADLDAAVRAMEGTPDELLNNDELMALMRPIIRADFTVSETWNYVPQTTQLPVAVTVLGGEDEFRGRLDELTDWSKITSENCKVVFFPGGHFFIQSSRDSVIKLLIRELV